MTTYSTYPSMTHFQLVGEFHDVFGHAQRTELYRECFMVDPSLVPFRIQLIREELNEFEDALKNKDMVEMFDALCDLAYVTHGAGQCLGINLNDVVLETFSVSETFSVLETNNISGTNIVSDNLDNFAFGITQIHNAVNKFCESSYEKNLVEMHISLRNILHTTYDLGYSMGGNMDLMFREVHRSNMTKVCNNLEDAVTSVEIYKKDARYAKPSIRIKGHYFVVYDETTTKILKNHKWEQPNLKQFF